MYPERETNIMFIPEEIEVLKECCRKVHRGLAYESEFAKSLTLKWGKTVTNNDINTALKRYGNK